MGDSIRGIGDGHRIGDPSGEGLLGACFLAGAGRVGTRSYAAVNSLASRTRIFMVKLLFSFCKHFWYRSNTGRASGPVVPKKKPQLVSCESGMVSEATTTNRTPSWAAIPIAQELELGYTVHGQPVSSVQRVPLKLFRKPRLTLQDVPDILQESPTRSSKVLPMYPPGGLRSVCSPRYPIHPYKLSQA